MENNTKDEIKKSFKSYAKLGLAVIPCKGKDKSPLLKGWNKRKNPPTESEIEDWMSKYHLPNIGLVLGNESGIVGVDIDGKEAGNRFMEISSEEDRKTWHYSTPGGGERFLYQAPKGFKGKKYREPFGEEHSEMAFLGAGQQTILPPSIHPNGGKYTWIEGNEPWSLKIKPAPKWLLDKMDVNSQTTGINKVDTAMINKNIGIDAEKLLDKLATKCRKFKGDLLIQRGDVGLCEDKWFLWSNILVFAYSVDVAMYFSMRSKKHNQRSEERIRQLGDNCNNAKGYIRCTTMGCDERQCIKCFGKVHKNSEGEISNSVVNLIKNNVNEKNQINQIIVPPQLTEYSKYLKQDNSFFIDENGNLCFIDEKGNSSKLSNFLCRITHEITKIDGKDKHKILKLGGMSMKEELNPIEITTAEFLAMNWVIDKWGIGAIIYPNYAGKEKVRTAIQLMSSNVVKENIYTNTGWQKMDNKDKYFYLHSKGAIGLENARVEVDNQIKRYQFPDNISDDKNYIKICLDFLQVAPYKITIPLLSTAFLSILVSFFKSIGAEPKFVLWISGETGSFKTTLAMLTLSFFGDFNSSTNPPASFRDTVNSIEVKSYRLKDSLLIIDDYHPENTVGARNKMGNIAEGVLRAYGDRVGRNRLTSSIELRKEYPPRGMAMVTGEDMPNGQSAVSRFLGVEINKGDVNKEALTRLQDKRQDLNMAMASFIKHIFEIQGDDLNKLLKDKFEIARKNYANKAVHGRIGENVAWLEVSFNIFLKWLEDNEVVTSEEKKSLIEQSKLVFDGMVKFQNNIIKIQKPEEVFIEALEEMLNAGVVYIKKLVNGKATECRIGAGMTCIGYYDAEYVYLFPQITYGKIMLFLSRKGEIISVSDKTLWKHLKNADMIKTENEDKGSQNLPKKTINDKKQYGHGIRKRMIHLFRDCIDLDSFSTEDDSLSLESPAIGF